MCVVCFVMPTPGEISTKRVTHPLEKLGNVQVKKFIENVRYYLRNSNFQDHCGE